MNRYEVNSDFCLLYSYCVAFYPEINVCYCCCHYKKARLNGSFYGSLTQTSQKGLLFFMGYLFELKVTFISH